MRLRRARTESWLESDTGKIVRYRDRKRCRFRMAISDIEPQSKRMRKADCDRFQTVVLEQMAAIKKRPFRGELALRLHVRTTSMTPPHVQTIAKKLLDLLGSRRRSVGSRGRYVLYRDDSQVQVLAVSCRHGEDSPFIHIEARSISAMREDLQLADDVIRETDTADMTRSYEQEREKESIDDLRELISDTRGLRQRWGEEVYSAMVKSCRREAQGALLGRGMVDIPVLCAMYGRPDGKGSGLPTEFWTQLVAETPLRLQVGELPVKRGESLAFRERIDREIATFKKRWGWVLEPLLVPIGLEVVIRPNPETPPAVLHDLDNVVREYLIPEIVPSFDIVSDFRWTTDFEELRATSPEWVERYARKMPPKGTKAGVNGYQMWRVPAVEGQPGFVSVALLAEDHKLVDPFEPVDSRIEDWIGKRERSRPGY